MLYTHKSKPEWARGWVKSGYRIIPCKPLTKKPSVKTWGEGKDWPSNDMKQVEAHWKANPEDNIALYAGGLWILDIDVKDGEKGEASLAAFQKEHPLPVTLETRTPSGGRHLIFKMPEGRKARNAVKIAPGLDIRTDGGYVIVPGSTLENGAYTMTRPMVPAVAPERALALREPRKPTSEPAISTNPDTAESRAIDFLKSLPAAPDGARNDSLMLAGRRLGDLGVTESRAVDLAQEHFKADPPVDQDEIETTVRSSYKNREEPIGALTAEGLGLTPVEGAEKSAPPADLNLWLDWNSEPPKVWHDPYIVKNWLWEKNDTQIFGPTNVGKTFLALHLGVHVASGAPWFEQRTKQGGVIYLPYEGIQALPRRMAALRLKYPSLPWKDMPFRICPMNAPLVTEKGDQAKLPGWVRLRAAMESHKKQYGTPPSVAIVDTYSRAIGGSASDEVLAGSFAVMAGVLRADYGTMMVRIHHPGHTNAERARGSYAIGAGLDVDLRISEGRIEAPKQRDAEKNKLGFKLEIVRLGVDQDGEVITSCAVMPGPLQNELDLTDQQQAVMDIVLTSAGDRNRVARGRVLEECRKAGIVTEGKKGGDRLADFLDQLKKKHRLTCKDGQITLLERGALKGFDEEEAED